MEIVHVEKDGNFTWMKNIHLRDRFLSLKAKGLLSVMFSLPKDWDCTITGLAYISKEGISAIRATIKELEAAQVPRSIDDVDLAVINSNFAMQVPLNPVKDSLYIEDATSPYVNIVAVRQGDEERPEIKALIKALQSEKVKKFIEEKYQGAVVATF